MVDVIVFIDDEILVWKPTATCPEPGGSASKECFSHRTMLAFCKPLWSRVPFTLSDYQLKKPGQNSLENDIILKFRGTLETFWTQSHPI